MRQQERITSDGRSIEIYDDVFPPYLRAHHIGLCQVYPYCLSNSGTSSIFWQLKDKFFQCGLSQKDFEYFKFENDLISNRLIDYEIKSNWIVASTPFTNYYYHTDTSLEKDQLTLLYYVNTRWDRNWGGETLFSNDSGESEIVVEYRPGRVVIFDSIIEHKPAAISPSADEFRFIFVLQLKKKNS